MSFSLTQCRRCQHDRFTSIEASKYFVESLIIDYPTHSMRCTRHLQTFILQQLPLPAQWARKNVNFNASKNTNMNSVFLLMFVPIRSEHKHRLFFSTRFRKNLFFFGFSRLTGGSKISYLCQVIVEPCGSSSHRRDEVSFLVFASSALFGRAS